MKFMKTKWRAAAAIAGGPTGREGVRNQRYKLYRTGKFYDISNDVLEKQPLKTLSPEAQEARALFEEVLDTYKDARPASAAAKGKQKTKSRDKTQPANRKK